MAPPSVQLRWGRQAQGHASPASALNYHSAICVNDGGCDFLKMARILVIDDDPGMRAMLEQVLKAAGYEVVSAANGKLGMELQRASPAHLVITDLFMPEKEGMETIMELRRDFPEVAVIAMSGKHGAGSLLAATKRLGAALTLEKPFQSDELLAAVEQVLKMK
jgi:DNA-binding NtrC family response regulator